MTRLAAFQKFAPNRISEVALVENALEVCDFTGIETQLGNAHAVCSGSPIGSGGSAAGVTCLIASMM
jgi:hypothetical protein